MMMNYVWIYQSSFLLVVILTDQLGCYVSTLYVCMLAQRGMQEMATVTMLYTVNSTHLNISFHLSF